MIERIKSADDITVITCFGSAFLTHISRCSRRGIGGRAGTNGERNEVADDVFYESGMLHINLLFCRRKWREWNGLGFARSTVSD